VTTERLVPLKKKAGDMMMSLYTNQLVLLANHIKPPSNRFNTKMKSNSQSLLLKPVKSIHNFFLTLSKTLSRKNLHNFLDHQFAVIPPGAIVANIGSGGKVEEQLRHWARKTGFEVRSMDIDNARGPDLVCDITQPHLPPESFDVLVIAEVLEHVTDPHAAARGIQHLLKPSGRVILTVPFLFPIHDRPHDYFRYTQYGLAHLFNWLTELHIAPRNSWAEAINVLASRLIMEKSISARLASPIAVTIAMALMPLAWLLGNLIKTDFITTGYTLTGTKPARLDTPLPTTGDAATCS
jgi:SAM-dependent methyltransferase